MFHLDLSQSMWLNLQVRPVFHVSSLLFPGVRLGRRLQRLRGNWQRRLAVRCWFSNVGFTRHSLNPPAASSDSDHVHSCNLHLVICSCSSFFVFIHAGRITATKPWRTLFVAGDGPGTVKKQRWQNRVHCWVDAPKESIQLDTFLLGFNICLSVNRSKLIFLMCVFIQTFWQISFL